MREIKIEEFLIEAVKARGGQAIKLGHGGWPDRIVALPRARIGFLELKRPGEEPEPLQWARISALRSLGFQAEYANSYAMVEDFVRRTNLEQPR